MILAVAVLVASMMVPLAMMLATAVVVVVVFAAVLRLCMSLGVEVRNQLAASALVGEEWGDGSTLQKFPILNQKA